MTKYLVSDVALEILGDGGFIGLSDFSPNGYRMILHDDLHCIDDCPGEGWKWIEDKGEYSNGYWEYPLHEIQPSSDQELRMSTKKEFYNESYKAGYDKIKQEIVSYIASIDGTIVTPLNVVFDWLYRLEVLIRKDERFYRDELLKEFDNLVYKYKKLQNELFLEKEKIKRYSPLED